MLFCHLSPPHSAMCPGHPSCQFLWIHLADFMSALYAWIAWPMDLLHVPPPIPKSPADGDRSISNFLFINIPAVNIYGLLSLHISFIHLYCRCYSSVIYILAQYRGLAVRTMYRTALVSPCSYGIYSDVVRQDREYSAFFPPVSICIKQSRIFIQLTLHPWSQG